MAEIKGNIVKVLPVQTGEGKNGTWRKQGFVLETRGEYAKKIFFIIWGDKIDQSPVKEGVKATVFFDLESREYQDRWFTDAKAWKVEIENDNSTTNNLNEQIRPTEEEDSILPF